MPFENFNTAPEEPAGPGRTRVAVYGDDIRFSRFRFDADAIHEEHSHPEEQVIYVLSGRFRVVSGGEEREIAAGEVCWHPSDVPHVVHSLEPGSELLSFRHKPGSS
jgi:quercetin dioxygenase-like cupin family protein